jgi:hypothetical protein
LSRIIAAPLFWIIGASVFARLKGAFGVVGEAQQNRRDIRRAQRGL